MMRHLRTMRLDVYLHASGYAVSRSEAQKMISEGIVFVGGKQISKSSFDVEGLENSVTVDSNVERFASRGGVKLRGAIDYFGINCYGRLCLDIGASSGGFTDCLLKHGASHVIAVDAGSGQLIASLRDDRRVTCIENFNARYMTSGDLEYSPDLIVMDVSFISATYIIPSIYEVAAHNSDFICLIKPQFEVGKSGLGKKGIVKSAEARTSAVKKVVEFAEAIGFIFIKHIESPIHGGDGNIEFLAHFYKD